MLAIPETKQSPMSTIHLPGKHVETVATLLYLLNNFQPSSIYYISRTSHWCNFQPAVNEGQELLEMAKVKEITIHIFLRRNFTDRSNDGKKEEQFFIPKFHADYDEVD